MYSKMLSEMMLIVLTMRMLKVMLRRMMFKLNDVNAGCICADVVVLLLGDDVVDVVDTVALDDAVRILNLIDVQ